MGSSFFIIMERNLAFYENLLGRHYEDWKENDLEILNPPTIKILEEIKTRRNSLLLPRVENLENILYYDASVNLFKKLLIEDPGKIETFLTSENLFERLGAYLMILSKTVISEKELNKEKIKNDLERLQNIVIQFKYFEEGIVAPNFIQLFYQIQLYYFNKFEEVIYPIPRFKELLKIITKEIQLTVNVLEEIGMTSTVIEEALKGKEKHARKE